jgi:ABC-type branched-subunit amino acid transport system substrate-binding protein
MRLSSRQLVLRATPIAVAAGLMLAACGGSGSNVAVAQEPNAAPPAETVSGASGPAATTNALTSTVGAPVTGQAATSAVSPAKSRTNSIPAKTTVTNRAAATKPAASSATSTGPGKAVAQASGTTASNTSAEASTAPANRESPAEVAANQGIYDQKQGATDVGITKDQIKLGTVNMHGMALGNVLVIPIVNGTKAAIASINDRGGVLGRRMSLTDCDDGPGEVARSKSCIKKLVGQDQIFALMGYSSWASASVHDDLAEYRLPAIGVWAYSQTEWQDPYMFPTHMSMIHEAMAGAHWVVDVIHPKTYGLICLTSPEMQLACNNVQQIVDASGAKMVKRVDVSISEASMGAYVLAFRAANPEHIIHYVINPMTMIKFMTEASQQGYYPPKGISGNHLATEVLGSLFGQWPVGRYWTNTTYKLWGSEFMATMNKYAAGNRGLNHHIVQAVYAGVLNFEHAAKEVGPNLTRQRLMAQLDNGGVYSADASLDQRFSYAPSERNGNNWNHDYGQGREFIYKYDATNTTSNPDGSPNGWAPDPNQFVIYTWK